MINEKNDMSIDDILKSIRKYVSEEEKEQELSTNGNANTLQESQEKQAADDPNVVTLQPDNIIEESQPINLNQDRENIVYKQHEDISNNSKPFSKLTEALKIKKNLEHKVEKPSVIEDYFEGLVRKEVSKWIEKNMQSIVESIVQKEIEKIKAE